MLHKYIVKRNKNVVEKSYRIINHLLIETYKFHFIFDSLTV